MSLRILIAEDEQIVAADMEDKLGRIGHEVIGIASSGQEAIAIAEQLRPELVLMDVRLRGTMERTEAARQIQRLTGAPIIFVTAFADVFLRDPKLMRPPGLCLSKPFSLQQLQVVLESIGGK